MTEALKEQAKSQNLKFPKKGEYKNYGKLADLGSFRTILSGRGA